MKVKMKKRDRIVLCIWIVICIVLYALLVRSCARRRTPSAARREEIRETFEALPHTDSYALARYYRWIIRGETYELDNPLYLDETGFFSASYVLSPVPTISFYHTEFEDLERELLGSAPLPSPYSPSFLWYSDGNFYYRADTPRGEEGGYEYRTYRWNVNDQVAVETDEDYPSAIADRESDGVRVWESHGEDKFIVPGAAFPLDLSPIFAYVALQLIESLLIRLVLYL